MYHLEKVNRDFVYLKKADDFQAQAHVIQSRSLLKYCYDIWYGKFLEDISSVSSKTNQVLELGSGGSYFKQFYPDLVTSDVVEGVGDLVVDARKIPFEDESLRALVASHVFHHISDIDKFLAEAERVLIDQGVISLIEVAHTPFSRFMCKLFHPEPYDEKRKSWSFDSRGNMDSNQALSWIVFKRDISEFERKFPTLKVERISYLPWFTYLLSGGVTKPSLFPKALNPIAIFLEKIFYPLRFLFALHWHITIRKVKA